MCFGVCDKQISLRYQKLILSSTLLISYFQTLSFANLHFNLYENSAVTWL